MLYIQYVADATQTVDKISVRCDKVTWDENDYDRVTAQGVEIFVDGDIFRVYRLDANGNEVTILERQVR